MRNRLIQKAMRMTIDDITVVFKLNHRGRIIWINNAIPGKARPTVNIVQYNGLNSPEMRISETADSACVAEYLIVINSATVR